MPGFKIRMKSTNQAALTTTFEAGTYTTVFQQNDFVPIAGWNTHEFTTPFNWDGSSIIIVDVVTTLIPGTYTQNASVFYTTTAPVNTCLRYQSDSIDAESSTATGTVSTFRANIRFNMTAVVVTDPPNPAILVSPGNASENNSLTSTLNWAPGTGLPTGYKLYLGTTNPPPFVEDVGNVLTYDPVLDYSNTYYWQIVPYNAIGEATNCPVWSFGTVPQGLVYIGTGTTGQRQPFGALYGYERSASIYTPAEIGAFGNVNLVGWDCSNTGTSGSASLPYKIYLKTVTEGTITPTPWNDLIADAQLVKEGSHIFNTLGWHGFSLDTPFLYTGGNLMVLVETNYGGSGASGMYPSFYYTSGTTGTHLYYNTDTNPPATNGTNNASRPNLMLHLSPPSDVPVLYYSPESWNFGDTLMNSNKTRDIFLSNGGQGTVNVQSISITGEYFSILDNPAPVALTLGQNAIFTVKYAPTEAGTHTGTITIVDDIRQTHTIQLSGTSIDATIYEMSHLENFDSVAIPNLPLGWTSIYQASVATGYVKTVTTTPHSAPNCVTIYNPTDINTIAMLIAPPLANSIPTNTVRVKFWGKGSTNYAIKVGIMTDPSDPTTFTELGTHTFTATWTEYQQSLAAYTGNGQFIALKHACNAATQTLYVDDIEFELMGENDLAGVSITGNSTPSVNAASPYTIHVLNNGTAVQSNYTVKLYSADHSELASATGTTVNPNDIVQIPISWTPTVEGPMSIYGKVILDGDINPGNDTTPLMQLAVQPEGVISVTIGDGSQTGRMPLDFYYKNSLYQGLWFPDEIGMVGNITSLTLYTNFTSNLSDKPVKIVMATTDATDLSSNWATGTNMVEVFNGTMNFPSGENTITFPFSTPFIYTGGNLVITFNRPMDAGYHSSTDYFKTQTGVVGRARNVFSDTVEYDPYNPTAGAATGVYPKISLTLTPMTGDPLFIVNPESWDYGDVNIGGFTSKNFSIINAGGGNLGINNILITGSPAFTLSTMPTLPASLATGESAVFGVTYTPTTTGAHSATVIITDNRGMRSTHSVEVNGNGVYELTIGDGSQTGRMPLDFFYKNSIYQMILTANEINNFAGIITGIKLYNQFATNLPNKPVQIWMGTTTQNDLSAGWIPASQLTQVFDGTVDFPSGTNTINIEFPNPYLFTGGNMVMIFKRPTATEYHASTDYFKTQTGTANRARNAFSDSVVHDPENPSGTTLTGVYPKISISYIAGDSGSLTGVVSSSGTPLEGVQLHINGTNFNATTNANGIYLFPFLLVDDYTITAHKIGYEDTTLPFSISDDETTTLNINMPASTTVTVSGTIYGSDNPGVGLSEATIALSGPLSYEGTSNASGQFSIPNVLSGNTYNYLITRAGYQFEAGTIVVGSSDYSMGNITLNELTLPPGGVTAELNATETAINITWRPPGQGGSALSFDFEDDDGGWEPSASWGDGIGDWEHTSDYNVANFVDSYGSTSVIPPTSAHSGTGMWGTKINTNYTNSGGSNYLSKTFNFTGLTDAHLSWYSWENVFGDFDYCQVKVNGNLIWGPSWDYTGTQWRLREIDLSAYDGNAEVEITFEMYATTVVNYAGWYIDDVEITQGPRSVMAYSPMPQVPAILRGLSEEEAARIAESLPRSNPAPVLSQSIAQAPNRIPVGYHVYKLMNGQEQQQQLWTQLTTTAITDTAFVDPSWTTLENGVHKWAVKTVYTGGVLSDPGFSNGLRKWPNDISALSIQGNTTPTVATASTYIVRIKNTGSSTQTVGAYTVKLMSGANELVSVPGPTITPGQSLDVQVVWTPGSAGTMQIFGKVVLPGDLSPENDNTDPMNVLVMPAGQFDYTVGNGGTAARNPINMYYKASISQTMYYPQELGNFYGFLHGIQYYNSFTTNLPNKPIKIYLGTTTLADLSAGFIPADNTHTLVFDGTVDFPTGVNTITIPFNNPYMYMNGENLLVTVVRPLDTAYFATTDNFDCQTIGSNRNRITQSDSIDYDAANPPATTTLSGIFPKTTFLGIPGGVGDFEGVVQGANLQPLAGVLVELVNAGYQAITNAQGEYYIQYILPEDYTARFSRHGYITQEIPIEIEEDETTTLNITMNLMPQVNVSGTILASDTGAGIAGANIRLNGYENYTGASVANGGFTIQNVFANQSYEYVISAAGYTTTTGIIDVGATNHNMGNITLSEVAYAPRAVSATLNDTYDAVNLTWIAPDPNAVEITEGFEDAEFPPSGWSQVITNTGPTNSLGVYPTWCSFGAINTGSGLVAPSEGTKQAGLWWVTEHQDEWLKTPAFNCPPDAYMVFDTHANFGSPNGDHYYVKISTNGGNTWTALWDASVLPEGTNHYQTPIQIDLSGFAGSEVILAFHAEDPPSNDGLWYVWFIDNIYIGNMMQTISFNANELIPGRISVNAGLSTNSSPNTDLSRAPSYRQQSLDMATQSAAPAKVNTRALIGYKIWRLTAGQEANESSWVSITPEVITTLNHVDTAWPDLNNGNYKWAVKAVYTANVLSAPSISNSLVKEQLNGTVVGFVRRTNNQGIPGAVVTASDGSTATTNTAGAYSMVLPVGIYSFTAVANGYHPLTQDEINVVPNQNTTLNFVLIPTSNEDEVVPVTVTALKGNYPNPFNPETTISYELKDAAQVSLEVYNLKGQLVRSLINKAQASGRYRIVFDGKDDRKQALPSGVYLYRFSAGEYHKTRKMMLMQ
ncbi:MAG: carboxypeptidase regulatory-like domain-containing protein [Candidatus Cloacimonetes bacterium]|nr:carboxypeptidase regulatory-like domain-containing protein [Candidatus Cloacimonadota bacterium]